MSEILIRGMEMPKTCADCHDADLPTAIAWLGAKCPWAHGIIDPCVYDLCHERHPDCPLHELPPHGDLIDRREIISDLDTAKQHPDFNGWDSYADGFARAFIETAPVVVPAERRDADA